MFRFNEVMNELGRATPKPTTPNRAAWANQRALEVFKLRSNGPMGRQSARAAPPPTPGRGQSRARTSQNTAAGQCPGASTAPTSANGRGRAKKGNSAGPQAAGCAPNVRSEPGAGRAARANQRRRLAAPERWDAAPPRAVVCVSAAAGTAPRHSPGGQRGGRGGRGVRRPRAAGARAEGGRPPAAAEPDRAPAEPCR